VEHTNLWFLVPQNADDIMFGNIFDKRLRLPPGFGAALKFVKSVIDPTIEQDLRSQTKPWALSPLVATMPYCSRTYVDEEKNDPLRRPGMLRPMSLNSLDGISPQEGKKRKRLKFDSSSHRQKYFRDPERRKEIEFGPEEIISTDFCHGFLEFNPSLALRLPIGMSFDLSRYWDKHPVKFVCCERKTGSVADGEDPWGRVFWCVKIEIVDFGCLR